MNEENIRISIILCVYYMSFDKFLLKTQYTNDIFTKKIFGKYLDEKILKDY